VKLKNSIRTIENLKTKLNSNEKNLDKKEETIGFLNEKNKT
jgi:hypothetical protein